MFGTFFARGHCNIFGIIQGVMHILKILAEVSSELIIVLGIFFVEVISELFIVLGIFFAEVIVIFSELFIVLAILLDEVIVIFSELFKVLGIFLAEVSSELIIVLGIFPRRGH